MAKYRFVGALRRAVSRGNGTSATDWGVVTLFHPKIASGLPITHEAITSDK